MLLQLRDFIQRERIVSTQQLAREFRIDEQALQPMLALWVSKGVIQLCQEKPNCHGGCGSCTKSTPEYYRFIDSLGINN